tara:strand:+ start:4030 stop:4431 length:402 start_codon:yes stop_codon:yes gene_type:complete
MEHIVIPFAEIPDFETIKTIEIPLPSADVPFYKPMVVPPSDLKEPEDTQPVETEEPPAPTLTLPPLPPIPIPPAEVLVTTTVAAVTAVAATTVAQPVIEQIKKRLQKFLQGKINKWKQNRQKKRDSSLSSKKT